MCIFQSEQVIKFINTLVSLGEKRMSSPPNSPDCHVWGAMLVRYQKYTPKPSNIAVLSIWNDLPQEFIDKAMLSFQRRLDFRVLLQLVDILNRVYGEYREGS